MMQWLLLAVGIIMEVCGTTCMKLSDGFSNLVPSVLTFVFWGIAFTIFIFALKTFDLSFAYAVWVGSGIVIVSIIGILHLRTRKCSEDRFNSPDCDRRYRSQCERSDPLIKRPRTAGYAYPQLRYHSRTPNFH